LVATPGHRSTTYIGTYLPTYIPRYINVFYICKTLVVESCESDDAITDCNNFANCMNKLTGDNKFESGVIIQQGKTRGENNILGEQRAATFWSLEKSSFLISEPSDGLFYGSAT
jgi:hypothetical protein